MPKLTVKKSIVIKASPEKVYGVVADFSQWQPWSPWLIMEDGVKVNVRADKKYYEWEGDLVGAGNMTVASEKEFTRIDYDLMFLKPWKSKAKVAFELEKQGDETLVTWYMNSSLPFFLFWMKKMTENFIGMDYDRGLKMLKDYVEDGTVHSKLSFKGISQFEGAKYIAINTECAIQDMPENSKRDFTKLMTYMRDNHADIMDKAMSIYHKWDMRKQRVNYSACAIVSEIPKDLPAGFVTGEYPKAKVYAVHHTGPYHHIGNAWTAQMMRQRGKVFKPSKQLHPMEYYINSPFDTDELALETEVLFPIA
ncbi:MAG: SRPBCC family protein [Flavobacteriales bacterium]|nr:SRPBCC family protein [Flavobacteriales bacterium]